MKRVTSLLILAVLVCAAACVASVPIYLCPRVSTAPAIDGRLDDPAWQIAPPVSLVLCQTGSPATRKTTARMCWDDNNLYVSFDCEDTDIWGTYTKRDDPVFTEESVEVFACPDCNIKSYYEIDVSPRNVVFDASIADPVAGKPTSQINAWDCLGLRTAVNVSGTLDCRTDTDKGWSAELSIPFVGLSRQVPKPGERWRLNLYRVDLSPEPVEFQAWSPTLCKPAAFHIPERFGTVLFTH